MGSPPPGGGFPGRIPELAFSFAPTLMLDAAIRNGVFEALDGGPRSAAALARKTGASERGLRALLEGLAGIGILAKDGERFRLPPESSARLVQGKPGYLGGIFLHAVGQLLPAWMGLSESVKTGKPVLAANKEEAGAPFFKEYAGSLFPLSYPAARDLAERLGIGEADRPVRVLDLAAGSGVWGIALAKRSRRVTVTAVDWPAVLETAREACARYGLTDRFRFVEGDLLSAELSGPFDVAVLGNILHSEGEERGRAILKRVARLLPAGGKIAVADWLVDGGRTGPGTALAFALNMLVTTERGDVFSFEDIRGWLEDAGFAKTERVDLLPPLSLMLAEKA